MYRRPGHVGLGGALDDGGSIGLGGSQRARAHREDDAHPEALTALPEAVDGTAAGTLESGRPVADEKRDPGRADGVEGALVAERGAELAAFVQAGAGWPGSVQAAAAPTASRPLAMRDGAPTWRVSASASFASGTAAGALPISR
jgi:hypothetical protein